MRWMIAMVLCAQVAHADPVADVAAAAQDSFARMPPVLLVERIAGNCGATELVDTRVAYCTSGDTVLVAVAAMALPEIPYLVGHAYGHAVQVQHGIADFALREIRTRPEDEVMLRGLVERQVDCIAGFIVGRAGLATPDLTTFFDADPLQQPHWGRDPLRIGPVVDVPLTARADWFKVGLAGDIAACAPGEFTGLGLVRALREGP
ncbi:MAG: hypothetical protein ACSHW1_06255 [Yoonia sp.]|uniref:hypothetical protein n=1 Tax=Yoonia sp. TaxID=2212373 RepID=UPI003EF3787C